MKQEIDTRYNDMWFLTWIYFQNDQNDFDTVERNNPK